MLLDSTNCPRCHHPLQVIPCGIRKVCQRCGLEVDMLYHVEVENDRYGALS